MNPECDVNQSELSRYLDGELAPSQSRELADHLAQCTACRRSLDELERVQGILASQSAAQAPDHWERIRERIEKRKAVHNMKRSSGRQWKKWVPLAAGVLLFAAALRFFLPSGPNASTDVESYLGLYLLAASANDVISSSVSLESLAGQNLDFTVYAPDSMNGWDRRALYSHKLHGQPLVQALYVAPQGRQYCVFQQSARHALDFGDRVTQQEFVQSRICTKFTDHHFNLISWTLGNTLFTVVSPAQTEDLRRIAEQWMEEVDQARRSR